MSTFTLFLRLSILTIVAINFGILHAQPFTDYIGAGHDAGIKVTTSSDQEREDFMPVASGYKTLNGSGLDYKQMEAARFLFHTTFGYNQEAINHFIEIGPDEWLEEQFNIDRSLYLYQMRDLAQKKYDYYVTHGKDSSEVSPYPYWTDWRYTWWDVNIYGKDQLRQRMAYALSQILVVSDESDLGGFADALASYYDLLSKHAFGNFKDLLYEVALHPAMGYYLSHLNNPREIPEENIHPDQNFAREIMQLFTIGLYELNVDGSRKKDAFGNDIPTYDNNDIVELAKVFTGLSVGAVQPEMGDLYFGRGFYGSDVTVPMAMFEEWHQAGEKNLLKTKIIPDGQDGLKDIKDAVDFLFNHPNVGPFICRQLIQRFITSNPSPQYIERVASIFNNDGQGVRGNLKAVLLAIITDEEARDCMNTSNPQFGKLLEPTLRYSHFLKGIGLNHPSGYFMNIGNDLDNTTFQHPLSSPSVFNFYLPDHKPIGPIGDQNLVAPEFQILNSLTALEYANYVFSMTFYEYATGNWEEEYFRTYVNGSKFFESAHDEETLINQLDLLFCHGSMSDFTRATIKEALKASTPTLDGYAQKVHHAMYLTFISPDYLMKK